MSDVPLMKKKPFLTICSVRKMEKKDLWISLGTLLFSFFLLPLVLRLIFGNKADNWLVLLILPVVLVVMGVVFGIKYGFVPLFPAAAAAFSALSTWIYGIRPVWQYVIWFAVIAAAINLAVEFFYSTRKRPLEGLWNDKPSGPMEDERKKDHHIDFTKE